MVSASSRTLYASSFYASRQAFPTYTATSECQRVSDYTPPLSGCGTATLAEAWAMTSYAQKLKNVEESLNPEKLSDL